MAIAAISLGNFMSWALVLALSAALCIGLIVLAVYWVGKVLPASEEGYMKGMTTFITVLIGMIILLVMFYLLMEQYGKPRFDDALKAAALIIAPLGTFIGFVAGQSAGSAGSDRAMKIAMAGQGAGNRAAGEADKRLEDLLAAERNRVEEQNFTMQMMAGKMSEDAVEEILLKVRSLRS